ncbi:hypothetical protein Leryth_018073 [Lithospermum erythrorhizon]|nr:hypothetical protein Leryth_018073 [Lithospermum erythrorhizon]
MSRRRVSSPRTCLGVRSVSGNSRMTECGQIRLTIATCCRGSDMRRAQGEASMDDVSYLVIIAAFKYEKKSVQEEVQRPKLKSGDKWGTCCCTAQAYINGLRCCPDDHFLGEDSQRVLHCHSRPLRCIQV